MSQGDSKLFSGDGEQSTQWHGPGWDAGGAVAKLRSLTYTLKMFWNHEVLKEGTSR